MSVFTAYPMFESGEFDEVYFTIYIDFTVNLEPIYGIILAFFFWRIRKNEYCFYELSLVMILAIIY